MSDAQLWDDVIAERIIAARAAAGSTRRPDRRAPRGSPRPARSTWATCARCSPPTSSPRRCAAAARRRAPALVGRLRPLPQGPRRRRSNRSTGTSGCRWPRSPIPPAGRLLRRALHGRVPRRAGGARHPDDRGTPVGALSVGDLQRGDPPGDGRARPVFDALAGQQTAGRHERPLEERRARVLPVQALLRRCAVPTTRASPPTRDETVRLRVPPRPRRCDEPCRRGADQRQARMEGRLADALGA